MKRFSPLLLLIILSIGCKNNSNSTEDLSINQTLEDAPSFFESNQQVPSAQNIPLIEDQKDYTIIPIVKDLTNPWGMTWLPNSDLIYTEKEGKLYRFDGNRSHEISGVPAVYLRGQGGLLDVILKKTTGSIFPMPALKVRAREGIPQLQVPF